MGWETIVKRFVAAQLQHPATSLFYFLPIFISSYIHILTTLHNSHESLALTLSRSLIPLILQYLHIHTRIGQRLRRCLDAGCITRCWRCIPSSCAPCACAPVFPASRPYRRRCSRASNTRLLAASSFCTCSMRCILVYSIVL